MERSDNRHTDRRCFLLDVNRGIPSRVSGALVYTLAWLQVIVGDHMARAQIRQ